MMTNRKKNRKTVLGAIVLVMTFLSINAAFAQEPAPVPTQPPLKEDFEEKELTCFLNANLKINEIQMEAQGEMMKTIEDAGISVEKFNQMAQAQQQQDSTAQGQDPKDVESFQKASEKLMEMQQGIEGQMVAAVEDEGLNVEKYQQIAQAYQQSPKVKGQLDELMKKQQEEVGETAPAEKDEEPVK